MPRLFLLLILLLLGFSACSQPTATKLLCVDALHAARITDSLAALPESRLEARTWHHKADSLQEAVGVFERASLRNLDAKRAAEQAEAGEHALRLSESAKLAEYKQKAYRRAFVNYLFLALSLGAGYLHVTH